ncbi:MAG: hypothetical protein V4813_14845 [Gemmatimonadota bacterium]
MNWLFPLARVIGAGIPFGGVLVQISAELDSRQVQQRLTKLEDPISALHPDVRDFSRVVYEQMRATQTSRIQFADDDLTRHARVIALLENAGHLRGSHAIGQRHPIALWLESPQYVLYMAALYEDTDAMGRVFSHLDSAPPGTWLKGEGLATQYEVPLPVVRALFELYDSRGLGVLSKETGATNYMSRA